MFSFFLWSKLKQKTTEDLKKLKKQFQEDSYDELLSLKDYDIPASQPDDSNLSVKKRTKADQNSAVAQSSTMQTVEGKEHIEITPEKYHGLQAADLATLTHADLIRTLAPCFVEDQKTSGILASVSLAQFILETGWGKSKLFKETNNGFGIKASSGTKKSRTYKTNEYHKDGSKYTVQAQFRDYASFEDSLADHSAYLTSAKKNGKLRYAGLQGCTDYRRALDIIKKGGYATDPEYVSKLCNIIEKNHLTQYDSVSVDHIMATPVSKHAIPLPEKLLKKGSRGQAVKEVQTRLIACGYSCGRT